MHASSSGDNGVGGHPGNGGGGRTSGNIGRDIPVYAITIPFSSEGKSMFEPNEISIPTGMTVIWFNNDNGPHTVTTNSIYSPPETIQSGVIPPDGRSFVHQFNHPGRYLYFDQFNPSAFGIINVGSDIERGKNFDMQIGGINSIPFNPNKVQNVVLSFVPKSIKIPPAISLDYSVTILDSTGNSLYSHTYTDSDGILDLELIPIKEQDQQFTAWGPDLETLHSDGVFHISGPVLVQDSPYSIQVSIFAIDDREVQNPISETFDLLALPSGLNK
jgi:plastocyanin